MVQKSPELPRVGTRARAYVDTIRRCPGISDLELADKYHEPISLVAGTTSMYRRRGLLELFWDDERQQRGWRLTYDAEFRISLRGLLGTQR